MNKHQKIGLIFLILVSLSICYTSLAKEMQPTPTKSEVKQRISLLVHETFNNSGNPYRSNHVVLNNYLKQGWLIESSHTTYGAGGGETYSVTFCVLIVLVK